MVARIGAVNPMRAHVPALWACALFAAVVQPVHAQDTPDENDDTHLLSLTHLDAYLEFEGEFTSNRVKADNRLGFRRSVSQKNRAWRFEERIGLRIGGAILDPRFLTFDGDFSFALTQNRFEEVTRDFNRTDDNSGYLLQYDLRINVLPGKMYSGSAYGLRQDDRINRRFQPTLNQRRTGFGTSWVLSHNRFPMEFSYDYMETDRTGNASDRDDEHYTESTFHYNVDWLIDEGHKLKFSYEHSETKQEFQGLGQPFETVRDLFKVEDELRFGENDRHTLRTSIHWQEESGDFARDLFEIGPQLTLRHSDSFQTIYKYQYNKERFEGLDIDTHRADFQFVHQKYTNLTTTFDAFILYEDVDDDVETKQYGTSIDWQYNRRNPLGHLYANLALAYDTEETDGGNGVRLILNEAVLLRDPFPATLRNRNIIPVSIIVTDASNRRFYQIGVDYTMIFIGNSVQIVRVRDGRITDGETVLVDYQYRTPADGQLDTMRFDFSIEQRFKNGLTPYYRMSYRNQEDDASTGFASRADRTNHHRIGATFEKERYSLGAEYEIFDDTVDPYDAFHVNGSWRLIRNSRQTLEAAARFSRLFFEGGIDSRSVTLVDVELDHRRRLTDALTSVSRLGYRWEDDSEDGRTKGWDVTTGIEYVVGDLAGEITFEYDRLELPGSTEDDFGVYFRLRRDIPNVLTR